MDACITKKRGAISFLLLSVFHFVFQVAVFAKPAETCVVELVRLNRQSVEASVAAAIKKRTAPLSQYSPELRLAPDFPMSEPGYSMDLSFAMERLFSDAIFFGARQHISSHIEKIGKAWKKAFKNDVDMRQKAEQQERQEDHLAYQALRRAGRDQSEEGRALRSKLSRPLLGAIYDESTGLNTTEFTRRHPKESLRFLNDFEEARRQPITKRLYQYFSLKNQKSVAHFYSILSPSADPEIVTEILNEASEQIRQILIAHKGDDLDLSVADVQQINGLVKLSQEKLVEAFKRDFSDLAEADLQRLVGDVLLNAGSSEFAPSLSKVSKDERNILNQGLPGAVDFEIKVAMRVIDRIIDQATRNFMDSSKQIAAPVFEDYHSGNAAVRWDSFLHQVESQIKYFQNQLRVNAPLLRNEAERRLLLDASSRVDISAYRAKWDGSRGRLVIEMPQVGYAEYDPDLATVLVYAKPFSEMHSGVLSILLHGEGTNQSHAGSWNSVMIRKDSAGFNPVAIATPRSGPMPTVALNIEGVEQNASYMHMVTQSLRERAGERPVVIEGRSAGSTKAFYYSMIYDLIHGEKPLVDAFFIRSTSNPRTLDEQLKNVWRQVDEGIITDVVPEALDSFTAIATNGNEVGNRLNEKMRLKLFEYADSILFLQGEDDEDGGLNVIGDLEKFREDQAPLASLFKFESPFRNQEKYPGLFKADGTPDYSVVKIEYREATHFLDTNRSNLSMNDWKNLWKSAGLPVMDIDPKDLPALSDQMDQAMALQHAYLDYLERYTPLLEISEVSQERSSRLKADREKMLQEAGLDTQMTRLEWFRRHVLKKPILDSEYKKAPPLQRGGSLASRIKFVEQWAFELEPARKRELLIRNGLLK